MTPYSKSILKCCRQHIITLCLCVNIYVPFLCETGKCKEPTWQIPYYNNDLCFLSICYSLSLLYYIHTANCTQAASVARGPGRRSWGAEIMPQGKRPVWFGLCLTPQVEHGAQAVCGLTIQCCCRSQKQAAMQKEYKTETWRAGKTFINSAHLPHQKNY